LQNLEKREAHRKDNSELKKLSRNPLNLVGHKRGTVFKDSQRTTRLEDFSSSKM